MGSESIESAAVSRSSSAGKFFPPGFRFHPTDEELVLYYLKRKICGRSLQLDIITEIDVYKWDPQELPGLSKWKTGDRQWFFFSPRDRKYPNGGRSNRGTMHGYWKATGKDRIIKCNSRSVGIKKTLVYYEGRAPSGQRTNWVMHEYTLDEDELKRCRHPQDYFALYKLFKKSGPGPKNGEQYGAPFVEEEWADDDCLDLDPFLTGPISAQITPLIREEGSGKVNLDQGLLMGSSNMTPDLHPAPELTQPTNEASEVTLVKKTPFVINEDFLEMDDLIGPQPTFQNPEKPAADDLQFPDFDGLYEFDLYNDVRQQIQQPYYMNNLEYPVNTEYQTSYDLWAHNQTNEDFTATQANESEVVDPEFDLWTHNQRNDYSMAAQDADITVSAHSSGDVVDENQNRENSEPQYPNPKQDDGSDSWFASALWAFVESIPTTPASAAESGASVFERMSSFGRGRDGSGNRNGNGNVQRSSRSSRGIIYFSFLGVLFAILFVFLGTSIELLLRCVS